MAAPLRRMMPWETKEDYLRYLEWRKNSNPYKRLFDLFSSKDKK